MGFIPEIVEPPAEQVPDTPHAPSYNDGTIEGVDGTGATAVGHFIEGGPIGWAAGVILVPVYLLVRKLRRRRNTKATLA